MCVDSDNKVRVVEIKKSDVSKIVTSVVNVYPLELNSGTEEPETDGSDSDSDALSAIESASNETADRRSSSSTNAGDVDFPQGSKRRAARNFEAQLKKWTMQNIVLSYLEGVRYLAHS